MQKDKKPDDGSEEECLLDNEEIDLVQQGGSEYKSLWAEIPSPSPTIGLLPYNWDGCA